MIALFIFIIVILALDFFNTGGVIWRNLMISKTEFYTLYQLFLVLVLVISISAVIQAIIHHYNLLPRIRKPLSPFDSDEEEFPSHNEEIEEKSNPPS